MLTFSHDLRKISVHEALGPYVPPEMHKLTGKPVFGETEPDSIARQVHETIAEMDGKNLMIGPGCSVNPGVDEALIGAAVDATRIARLAG